MPKTKSIFFKDADGSVPVKDWLDCFVASRDERIAAKCRAAIGHLENTGLSARRPFVEYLEKGIYELRVKYGHVNYRILYFFKDNATVVLASGLTKEDVVPQK